MASRPQRSSSLSLKARALRLLAQREHSRDELRRKLLALAPLAALEPPDGQVPAEGVEARLDALLDALAASGHLSDERFVESRVHARAARFGNRRILHELGQHGLAPDEAQLGQLKASEPERLQGVWERKFAGQHPASAQEEARQMRFLASRGFSPEAIRQFMRHLHDRG